MMILDGCLKAFVVISAALTMLCVSSTNNGLQILKIPEELARLPILDRLYNLHSFGPKAAIDNNSITVSGLSSGAFMAMQMHFAHSSLIKGVGMFAGGPYGAAYDLPPGVVTGKLNFVLLLAYPSGKSVSTLIRQAQRFETSGRIDKLSNLNGSRAYIFHGRLDPVIRYEHGVRASEMYKHFGVHVKFKSLQATHGVPTDNFGGRCAVLELKNDGINNCGYQGIFDMFGKLYDNFIIPSRSSGPEAPGSHYYSFDQSPFVPPGHGSDPTKVYMARNGYIYIPPGCQNRSVTCRLHVALHSCFQSVYSAVLPNYFALKTGYIQAADTNNIVIVFPQAGVHSIDQRYSNFFCWDFTGGTSPNFLYKTAPQIQTVFNIIASLTGRSPRPL